MAQFIILFIVLSMKAFAILMERNRAAIFQVPAKMSKNESQLRNYQI